MLCLFIVTFICITLIVCENILKHTIFNMIKNNFVSKRYVQIQFEPDPCLRGNEPSDAGYRYPSEWAMQVLSDPDSVLQKSEYSDQSGFDLNEEDMIKFHIWPSGTIPYYIDDLSFDKVLKDRIRLYLNNINIATGLRFNEILTPPEDDKSRWVLFINRIGQLGCVDLPFRNFTTEGVQRVVLGYDCLAAGKISAIILSLVGVPPQHNAPDRDTEITVFQENILPDKLNFFDKFKDDEWLFYECNYDFNSAGHYSSHQYTSNGGETILIPYNGKDWLHEKGFGLSTTDVKKIYMLYDFITRKDTPKKVPGCDKLFAPGINIGNYNQNASVKLEPRKKPNRYLLLPEIKPIQYISTKNRNVKLLSHKLIKEKILNESDYETDEESYEIYET